MLEARFPFLLLLLLRASVCIICAIVSFQCLRREQKPLEHTPCLSRGTIVSSPRAPLEEIFQIPVALAAVTRSGPMQTHEKKKRKTQPTYKAPRPYDKPSIPQLFLCCAVLCKEAQQSESCSLYNVLDVCMYVNLSALRFAINTTFTLASVHFDNRAAISNRHFLNTKATHPNTNAWLDRFLGSNPTVPTLRSETKWRKRV